ncbi:hypothetical protein HQ524_00475 [Candidatus Uhrbacteria bacterium]|nr:hypothetical protein [Candidatus Uhrbacteria bacterium]
MAQADVDVDEPKTILDLLWMPREEGDAQRLTAAIIRMKKRRKDKLQTSFSFEVGPESVTFSFLGTRYEVACLDGVLRIKSLAFIASRL